MENIKPKLDAAAEKIPGYLLWQVSKLWQRQLNAALVDLNLSSTQAVILINVPRLNNEQKTVTQMLLSEVTKVDRMTVSQAIRTLERKGLINRVAAPTNRRAYHVKLTETGSNVAAQAIQRIIGAHEAFFKPLAGNTETYVALTQQLIKANNITEDFNEPSNKGN